MRRSFVLLAAIAAASIACDGDRPDRKSVPSATAAPKPPVEAPTGLLMEMLLVNPERSWTRIHQGVPKVGELTPRSIGGLAVSLLGLPLGSVGDLDEKLPAAAALRKEGDKLQFACAIHVRDPASFSARISHGEDAPFRTRRDADYRWLERTKAARSPQLGDTHLALHEHHLVIGNDEAAVRALAPYLTRTVAAGAQLEGAPTKGFAATITTEGLRWAETRLEQWGELLIPGQIGTPLDVLADPQSLREALRYGFASAQEATVTAELIQGRARVTALLRARDKSALSELRAIPTIAPPRLLQLPDDTMVLLGWVEPKAQRRASASSRAQALTKLLKVDDDNVAHLLGDIAAARGDVTVAGARCSGIGVTAYATGDVDDAGKLSEGLKALTALRKTSAATHYLAEHELKLTVKRTRVRNVPLPVTKLRLASKRDEPAASPVALVYGIEGKRFWLTAGNEASDSFSSLYAPAAETSLEHIEAWSRALDVHGKQGLWLALLADAGGVLACLSGRPGGSKTLVTALTVGPANDGAMIHLEAPLAALEAAMEAR